MKMLLVDGDLTTDQAWTRQFSTKLQICWEIVFVCQISIQIRKTYLVEHALHSLLLAKRGIARTEREAGESVYSDAVDERGGHASARRHETGLAWQTFTNYIDQERFATSSTALKIKVRYLNLISLW